MSRGLSHLTGIAPGAMVWENLWAESLTGGLLRQWPRKDEAAVRAAITSAGRADKPKVRSRTQARQASDVWPREDRLAPSPANRRRVKAAAPKIASEPHLDADPTD